MFFSSTVHPIGHFMFFCIKGDSSGHHVFSPGGTLEALNPFFSIERAAHYAFKYVRLTLCLDSKRFRHVFHMHITCNTHILMLIYAAVCTSSVQARVSVSSHRCNCDLKRSFTLHVCFPPLYTCHYSHEYLALSASNMQVI